MSSEQEIFVRIQTLLALERNYLSEQRTALSEFRTGLTLALVSPPAISLFHYLFEGIPNLNLVPVSILYLAFIFLTMIGIWISMRSRSRLKKIQQKIQLLKNRQLTVMKDSEAICRLLEDCVFL
jgi:hypothetical protein